MERRYAVNLAALRQRAADRNQRASKKGKIKLLFGACKIIGNPDHLTLIPFTFLPVEILLFRLGRFSHSSRKIKPLPKLLKKQKTRITTHLPILYIPLIIFKIFYTFLLFF